MDTFLWWYSECRDTRLLFTLGRAAWYVVRVQVSLGLSIRHMGSLIHGWVEVQISAIVTVCWWVDWDQKWLPWQPAMIRANLKTYFRSALSCPDLTKCPVVKGKQHVLFLPLHNTQQSLWHTKKNKKKNNNNCCVSTPLWFTNSETANTENERSWNTNKKERKKKKKAISGENLTAILAA